MAGVGRGCGHAGGKPLPRYAGRRRCRRPASVPSRRRGQKPPFARRPPRAVGTAQVSDRSKKASFLLLADHVNRAGATSSRWRWAHRRPHPKGLPGWSSRPRSRRRSVCRANPPSDQKICREPPSPPPRRLHSITDLDRLYRLDRHQRLGEPGAELTGPNGHGFQHRRALRRRAPRRRHLCRVAVVLADCTPPIIALDLGMEHPHRRFVDGGEIGWVWGAGCGVRPTFPMATTWLRTATLNFSQ